MSDGRKPTNKSTEKTTKEKQTQIRNSCFERKSLLISQTLQYKTLLPPWEKKQTLQTLSKTSQNNLKRFEHKLLIRKIILIPPHHHHHPPTRPSTSSEASLRCLLGLTAEQHVDLLFDPVLVVRLVRLCVRAIPEAAGKIILRFDFSVFLDFCLFCSLLEVKRSIPAVLRTGCLYTRAWTSYSELSKLIKIPHWIDDASGRAVPSALTGYLQSCGCESWLVLHLLDHFILKK